MLTAIVLGAGESSRMGDKNKMNLPFGRSTILETVLHNVINAKVDAVVLVLDKIPEVQSKILSHPKLSVTINENSGSGLTSSIQKGVQSSTLDSDLMICLGDMPLVSSKEYNYLINKFLENISQVIIQPYNDQNIGNPVIFSHQFREDILSLTESNGCRPVILTNSRYVQREMVLSDHYFRDIDTEQDYKDMLDSIPKS